MRAVLCSIASVAVVAADCSYEDNTDYNDGKTTGNVDVSSKEECCNKCAADADCVAAVYDGGGHSWCHPSCCWMKNADDVKSKVTKQGTTACVVKGGTPPAPVPKPTPQPPPAPPPGAPPCSLNGEPGADGACKCDKGWRGADCGQLDLLPAPPPDKQVAGLPNTTQPSTWGASVLKIGSTWHMWYTEIANGCPLGNYGTASQIVHATAASPLGPWARQDVALAAFAHNPQVVQNPETGELLLFHIGNDLPENCMPQCPDHKPNNTVPAGCPSLSHGSSVANASSPDGPWQRFPYAISNGDTNPAPIFVNGTLYVAVRGLGKFYTSEGNAAAGPWKSESAPVLNPQHGVWDEDPFVFVNSRGWHILGHRSAPGHGAGGHYYSADGHNWYMGGLAYDCTVTWAGGYTGEIVARQRPTLATDGSATYLYNGAALPCTDCSWCNWGCQYKHSFTMVQQLA